MDAFSPFILTSLCANRLLSGSKYDLIISINKRSPSQAQMARKQKEDLAEQVVWSSDSDSTDLRCTNGAVEPLRTLRILAK